MKQDFCDKPFLRADGFDDAIIGICEDFNKPTRLVYSIRKCIDILMKDNGMTEKRL